MSGKRTKEKDHIFYDYEVDMIFETNFKITKKWQKKLKSVYLGVL